MRFEHLIEVGHHVFHALHVFWRDGFHGAGHLVEVALGQLLFELLHEFLELLPGFR